MEGTITIHLHCMITPRPSLAEGVEDLNLLLVRVIIRTRCLQNHGNVVQSGVVHYTPESISSNVTFTNILMSVQVVPNFSFKPNIIPVLIYATLLLTLVMDAKFICHHLHVLSIHINPINIPQRKPNETNIYYTGILNIIHQHFLVPLSIEFIFLIFQISLE